MKQDIIHKTWTHITVLHNPTCQNYIQCLICGHTWKCNHDPVECPNCGHKLNDDDFQN